MNAKAQSRIKAIATELKRAKQKRSVSAKDHRARFALYREVIHLFEDGDTKASSRRGSLAFLHQPWKTLIRESLTQLGGSAEPSCMSLRDYNSEIHGPYLGVSDDGKAGNEFREAILRSPKAEVLGPQPPLVVGAALDAERLAAVGEVAVGPEEYLDIWSSSQGRVLMTTNVGTRLNLRYYAVRPVLDIQGGSTKSMMESALKQLPHLFTPFWRTLDGQPRPVTVFVAFSNGISYDIRLGLLRGLNQRVHSGGFCDPTLHKLGLLAKVGPGPAGVRAACRHMGMAGAAGIREVALRGHVRFESDDHVSMPGLLNYFNAPAVQSLMRTAQKKNIILTPKNIVDPHTVARHIWPALKIARNFGLALGKYGLFPLTLEEADTVMGLIQSWFADWSAAPVFYADLPLVTQDKIYEESQLEDGMKRWLDIVAKNRIPVVLFDTAEKAKHRRLMKRDPSDCAGILDEQQIDKINRYALRRGIKALWAGGIDLRQTLLLGRRHVFGIYVTTAAARERPVDGSAGKDPSLASERKVTYTGVQNAKLLLETGFLITRLCGVGQNDLATSLESAASTFLAEVEADPEKRPSAKSLHNLHALAMKAWRVHYGETRQYFHPCASTH